MNASKHLKKHWTLMKKRQRKNYMPFKLFEFLERFMIGAFLITLFQLEKTGSTDKFLFSWKFKNSIPFETRNR